MKRIILSIVFIGITFGLKAQDQTIGGNLTINGGTTGTSKKIIFKTSDNSDLSKYIGTENYWTIIGANGNEGWKFKDNTGDVIMQINGLGNNNGYVGIGTIPKYSLDVDGNFQRNSGVKHIMRLTHKNALDAGDGTSLLFTNRGSSNDYGGYIALVSTGSNPGWLNPRLDFAVQNPNTHQLSDISTKMTILGNGDIGIGTISPDMKLTVKGNIHAEEVKIDLNVPAPDYVFKEDYNLRSIEDIENYIKENKHLPEIPSAKEFEQDGIMQAEMDMSLLKKIEELTLYTIQQEKKIKEQDKEIDELKLLNNKFLELQTRLEKLESKN